MRRNRSIDALRGPGGRAAGSVRHAVDARGYRLADFRREPVSRRTRLVASAGFSCARRYRAIPLWMRTDDPTMSICLVMLIELAGLDATYAVRAQVRAEHIECRGCVLSVGQQLREDRHLLADDGAALGAVKSGVVSVE
jgi:hypothetical protein